MACAGKGALFCGKSTLDISSDAFVVLELERLQNDRELFGVASLQVLNAMTQDLYLSDRSQHRFLMFDEAWKYLIHSSADEKATGSGATSAIAAVIEKAIGAPASTTTAPSFVRMRCASATACAARCGRDDGGCQPLVRPARRRWA